MHTVMRVPSSPPDVSAKLSGLIEKLLALRAEIDMTLAEIQADTSSAYLANAAHASLVADPSAHTHTGQYSSLNDGTNDPFVQEEERHQVASADAADETTCDTEDDAQALPAREFHAEDEEPRVTYAGDDDRVDESVCVASADVAEAAESDLPTAEQQLAEEPAPATPAAADASEAANPLIEVATPQSVDDLTRIAGIDALTAGRLNAHGVTAYAQIAAWSAAEVAQISEALNIEHRVSKENWIEQAAILAAGGGTAFTRAAAADAPSPVALVEDPNLRPYEHMDDALKANAAAQLAETRIISLQEQRLKRAAQGAAVSPHGVRRRGRYAMATLATGFAASLGFAAVMLFDVDEIRARAAASETLRTLIHHTKRQFEPRPEPRDANATGSDSTSEDPNAQWIHQMQMWPPGA